MTEQRSEQIFDSLLSESLSGVRPPDLTARILAKWQTEIKENGGALRPPVTQEMVEPSLAELTASSSRKPSSSDAKVRLASSSVDRHKLLWTSIAAIAATLLVGVALWQNWPGGNKSNDNSLAQQSPPNPKQQASPAPAPAKTDPPQLATSERNNAASKRQELAIDDLPFGTSNPRLPSATTIEPQNTAPVTKLDDAAVVAMINSQLQSLWRNMQVAAPVPISKGQINERVAATLIGTTEIANLESVGTEELVAELVRSGRFAERASRFVLSQWLRGSAAARGGNAKADQLQAMLAEKIVQGRPWNRIIGDVLGSDPESPNSVFLDQYAGGDNHRLVQRIGEAMLDENLRCARCHDASDNGRVISVDQNDYWSLVALLKGLESQSNESGQRWIVDRQPDLVASGKFPSVYFDRPDGRLQAAQVRLPGGAEWRSVSGATTPRKALAEWVATSDLTDRAAVNLAWRMVFGRPLVAQHAALSGDGSNEKSALLIALAEQFATHDRDLGKLVGWLVRTQAFSAPALELDRQKWLLATDAKIANWQSSLSTFATFERPTVRQELSTLDRSIAAVVRWNGSSINDRTRLAQPNPEAPKVKSDTKPNAAVGETSAPVEFLVLGYRPTDAQRSIVSRLAASKLSWNEQVAHIAGMIGESSVNEQLANSAKQLLTNMDGNREAALERLLFSAIVADLSR